VIQRLKIVSLDILFGQSDQDGLVYS